VTGGILAENERWFGGLFMTSTAARTGPALRPGEAHWPAAGLLGGPSVETRHEMIGLGRPVRFDGGERLLREGENGSHAFLLRGRLPSRS
jgi:hypothetical protein